MVALNVQTDGTAMQLNQVHSTTHIHTRALRKRKCTYTTKHGQLITHISQGMFRVNGGCGYVLKPACLRTAATPFSPLAARSATMALSIRVISAFGLPRARVSYCTY